MVWFWTNGARRWEMIGTPLLEFAWIWLQLAFWGNWSKSSSLRRLNETQFAIDQYFKRGVKRTFHVWKFSRLLSWLSPSAIGIILVCYWTWRLLNEMGKFDIFNIITNQHKLQTSQSLKVWNSTNFKDFFSIILTNYEDIDWPRITMFPCQCINQIIIVVILSVYRALLNLIDQWSMTTLLTQKSFLFTHQAMHRVDKNPSCGIFFLEVKIMKQTLLSSMSSLFTLLIDLQSPLAILGHSGYPAMLSLAILGFPG